MRGITASLVLCLALPTLGLSNEGHYKKKQTCVSPAGAASFLELEHPKKFIAASSVTARSDVAGNILVIEAGPELLFLSNPFDLKQRTLQFQRVFGQQYTYSLGAIDFDGNVSQTISLADDASVEFPLGFQFPFAGKFYDRCFINSNGNITFEQPDTEPPNVDMLLQGPPRIAAFFTDLDPQGSGTVFVHQTPDNVSVTWLKVPEFYNQNQFDYGENTFQIVLRKDGTIRLGYTEDMSATQAVVGILPGHGKTPERTVDFSRNTGNRPLKSFLENFHDYESLDITALMKTVYKHQPDNFDFVSLFSNFELTVVPGAEALSINVQNKVRGIGNPQGKGNSIFGNTKKYESGGRLQNITFFGNIHQFPSDPGSAVLDQGISPLQILAHEIGHHWLSYIKLSQDGKAKDVLLGRDDSHWSFFFNSSASFLEGNQIQAKSSTSFQTLTPFRRYSDLDLYLMGFLPAESVRDSFYVANAQKFSPDFAFSSDSDPEANVTFRGNSVPVRIADVIAANGPRRPDSGSSQKNFRHLFVLIVKAQTPATAEELQQYELLRSRWESFFSQATGGIGKIDTKLP